MSCLLQSLSASSQAGGASGWPMAATGFGSLREDGHNPGTAPGIPIRRQQLWLFWASLSADSKAPRHRAQGEGGQSLGWQALRVEGSSLSAVARHLGCHNTEEQWISAPVQRDGTEKRFSLACFQARSS